MSDRVLLSEGVVITLRQDQLTTSRRHSAVPQLVRRGGSASVELNPAKVTCTNIGNARWNCNADVHKSVRLANTVVDCEGYTSRDDEFVLAGSCSVEYSLETVGTIPWAALICTMVFLVLTWSATRPSQSNSSNSVREYHDSGESSSVTSPTSRLNRVVHGSRKHSHQPHGPSRKVRTSALQFTSFSYPDTFTPEYAERDSSNDESSIPSTSYAVTINR